MASFLENDSIEDNGSGFVYHATSDISIKCIKNAKLGCFLDCRIYSNNNNGEFICTTAAKVLFTNNLLSESKKHQTRSKFACTQVTGEMHGCASLIWSADVGTNRAVRADQFDLVL